MNYVVQTYQSFLHKHASQYLDISDYVHKLNIKKLYNILIMAFGH